MRADSRRTLLTRSPPLAPPVTGLLRFLSPDRSNPPPTTLRREILAALTTFGAMGYVVVVNPQILSVTGADRHALIVITALAAMVGSLLMGLIGRLPVALAPAMGTNAVFAMAVAGGHGVTYGTALVMVLMGGVAFTLFSATRLREHVVMAFPEAIRVGLQCGLGLFIAKIGLRGGGLLTPAGQFGDLRHPAVMLAFAAVLVTPVLVLLRVPAALLLSILAVTLIGLVVPGADGRMLTHLPSALVQAPPWPSDYVMSFDFASFTSHLALALPLAGYFFLGDFFSATATLIGVTRRAGLMDASGRMPNARAAYLADGLGSIAGACLGSPTVAAYVESATGVESGGRTGLTPILVALLFALATFLWPLIAAIPPQATTPALVMVGVMMMDGIRHLDCTRLENTVSAVLIMLLTVTTGNLVVGLAAGAFAYTFMALALRIRLSPVLLLTDGLLALYLLLSALARHS
ncbi:xanthine/uracil/vitamin C transporter [Gluconacetobacter sacchari DSM 12717]|uniref:NCS2 family permease n=2 Tax=Gluconacetobacter sacchari TaxID=92759 RepID=A0A7W4NPZ2_9PROT|nr:NCS2 family permease [Gluconacetobacter sacchari]MBB2162059.1 NCS2 family permease [Gluconacetobacter sacchari]GBQ22617.1 xanthine/uracil/vitamin C transporter [Gluconacetobacter sacchari DSM 12717]